MSKKTELRLVPDELRALLKAIYVADVENLKGGVMRRAEIKIRNHLKAIGEPDE
jgi:hypothetical protein